MLRATLRLGAKKSRIGMYRRYVQTCDAQHAGRSKLCKFRAKPSDTQVSERSRSLAKANVGWICFDVAGPSLRAESDNTNFFFKGHNESANGWDAISSFRASTVRLFYEPDYSSCHQLQCGTAYSSIHPVELPKVYVKRDCWPRSSRHAYC